MDKDWIARGSLSSSSTTASSIAAKSTGGGWLGVRSPNCSSSQHTMLMRAVRRFLGVCQPFPDNGHALATTRVEHIFDLYLAEMIQKETTRPS